MEETSIGSGGSCFTTTCYDAADTLPFLPAAAAAMIPGLRPRVAGQPTRVELHAHLDGSVRHETIWELLREKDMPIPGDKTFRGLQTALVVRDPTNLMDILKRFSIYTPALAHDLVAMERVAYEFGVDKANQGILYVEARYAPHIWLNAGASRGKMTELGEVVKTVNRGFERAQNETGITIRTILSMINGMGIAKDILELAEQFRHDGSVVGIDLAGPNDRETMEGYEEVPLRPDEVNVFEAAAKSGVRRTVHAGEAGGAIMVKRAVETYCAERIGHGYHVFEDMDVYAMCKQKGIHFECCPWSSFLTGSVKTVGKHPITRFAEDGVSFSLNTDDTTLTGLDLQDDYDLAAHWGLTEMHIVRSNIDALNHSFLPDLEKACLMKKLLANLGVPKP